MSQHTQGQWYKYGHNICVRVGNTYAILAVVLQRGGLDPEEQKANMALMIEAPRMLTALKYVRDNAASDSPEMWKRVDDVIAKAEGK